MFRNAILLLLFSGQQGLAVESLVPGATMPAQPYWTTGASISSGDDLFVVIEGATHPVVALLKVSGGRFADPIPLPVPEDFQYFGNTAAASMNGFVFAGMDPRGSAVVYETDKRASAIANVGRFPGFVSVSVFALDGELWVTGQTAQKSPFVSRLNRKLEFEDIIVLPQTGDAVAKQIGKYRGSYFVLTQEMGPVDQTFIWKLTDAHTAGSKRRISGRGATFALAADGIFVSYHRDTVPTVDMLSYELKPLWSTLVVQPVGTGELTSIMTTDTAVIVVGGNNGRTYEARLSHAGKLLQLLYDDKSKLQNSDHGYILGVANNSLSMVGSFLDSSFDKIPANTIFVYTSALNSP